jgi:NDP-sugar pyrophosphorylase family protein
VKAVVLVGGEGTRLRPLTETIPKPLIPLVDRPFLHAVLDHLAAHDVHEVILSSPYLQDAFTTFIDERHGDPAITWITEATPLGTAGAVANAALDVNETILVLNGDILTDLDLTELVAFHRDRGAAGTITLTPVEDARPFGLVATEEDGRVLEFREKPADPVPGWVNAGTYVLEPSAVATIPAGRAVSIEHETFPDLIGSGRALFGFRSHAYWMDLGTPEKYLRATFDVLEGKVAGMERAAPHVDPTADVSLRSRLGRWVVLGPGASVGEDALVEDSVVLDGASIAAGAAVRDSILGPRSAVGDGARIDGCVLGAGARVPAGSVVEGARVRAEGAVQA